MSVTSTVPASPSLAGRVAGTVLRLRDAPNVRPDLRRGHNATTDRFAVPHLAPLWADTPWSRDPVLRFAALAATHADVGDDRPQPSDDGPGRHSLSLGRFLALTAHAGNAHERIGRRMVWVQTGDIEKLHVGVRNAMPRRVANGPRHVAWIDVARTYLRWDHPDRDARDAVRRRLLDDYFQTLKPIAKKDSK